MKKPESWTQLPHRLLEEIIWDIEDLEYCPYESSKAECIHNILNDNVSDTNRRVINAYWQALSDESFISKARGQLQGAKWYVAQLELILRQG
jgi:hypothetical protein